MTIVLDPRHCFKKDPRVEGIASMLGLGLRTVGEREPVDPFEGGDHALAGAEIGRMPASA
jgi:hypothetical protein